MGQYVDGGGAARLGGGGVIEGGGAFQEPPVLTIDGGGAGRSYAGVGAAVPLGVVLQGDPRLIMTPDGTRLQFMGGQPLMDAGLENLVLISLFTNKGWCGNGFMKAAIGSDFISACDQPITRQALNEIRAAAERALIDPALGRVSVTVTNPTGYQIRVQIHIDPPAGNPQELTLTKNGENWRSQAYGPAYPHITQRPWRKALVFEDADTLTDENGATLEF